MGSMPTAGGSLRASGTNGTFSTVARRLVLLLSMLLLDESLVGCEGMESHTQVLTATSSYPKCAGLIAHIRDGHCNEANNNADCGFDGGDCCAATCIAGLAHACGGDQEGGFDCRDPHVVIDPRRRLNSESCGGFPGNIGDTRCDSANNNFECSYDGGDCCECTCSPDLQAALVGEAYFYDHCGDGNFDCLDPACDSGGEISVPNPTPAPVYVRPVPSPTASPVPPPTEFPMARPTASPVPSPTASPVPPPTEFPVARPTASPVASPTASPVPPPTEFPVARPTASPVPIPTASPVPPPTEFPVARPTASPVASPTASTATSPTPIPASSPTLTTSGCGWPDSYIGDGDCDYGTNNLECNWDGGDCCECTCQETDDYQCPSFDCRDPDAPTDCGSTSFSTTSSRSTESPVPSPIYASSAPSSRETPGQASPGVISPVSRPTERPVPSPTETPEESGSSDRGSGSFTGSEPYLEEGSSSLTSGDRSVGGSGSYTDSDSSTGGGGLEEGDDETEEVGSTSSATLAATTGPFAVFNWEVVAVLYASGLGYYTLWGG